jgi:hypothetical protein
MPARKYPQRNLSGVQLGKFHGRRARAADAAVERVLHHEGAANPVDGAVEGEHVGLGADVVLA